MESNLKILRKFLNFIPENFKGKNRFSRALIGKNKINEYSIITKAGISYILPNLIENVSFELFINDNYETKTLDLIKTKLSNPKNIIDIGANIGSICIPLAQYYPESKVFCIEASPYVFKYLSENISQNPFSNLSCFNIALLNKNIDQIPFYSPKDQFGKGSLTAVFTQTPDFIKGLTLDSFIEQNEISSADFIKIDVEGHEALIFEGAKNVLKNQSPTILFEFVDWAENCVNGLKAGDAQTMLMSYGYKLYQFKKNKLVQLKEPLTNGACMILATK